MGTTQAKAANASQKNTLKKKLFKKTKDLSSSGTINLAISAEYQYYVSGENTKVQLWRPTRDKDTLSEAAELLRQEWHHALTLDILQYIVSSFFTVQDMLSLCQVSTTFYALFSHNIFWSKFLTLHFPHKKVPQDASFKEKYLYYSAKNQSCKIELNQTRIPEGGHYQVVLFGGGGVGKSAWIIQFLQSKFLTPYDPTVEEIYKVSARFTVIRKHNTNLPPKTKAINLTITDTPGQDEYSHLRHKYLVGSEGYIVFFSVDSRTSFQEAEAYLIDIFTKNKSEKKVVILVGNKCDLQKSIQVDRKSGRKLAQKYNIPYFESSARYGFTIHPVLYHLFCKLKNY